jgi:hypothetical protein
MNECILYIPLSLLSLSLSLSYTHTHCFSKMFPFILWPAPHDCVNLPASYSVSSMSLIKIGTSAGKCFDMLFFGW